MVTFRSSDLVLKPRSDYDPNLIRLDAYEAFIDALCGDREYQKDAIRTVCRYLGGGEYGSASSLAREAYSANSVLQDRYRTSEALISTLPFPEKLSCSVDVATGAGKSWIMYGVARILLAAGVVDRVLLLCPSLTIESGLRAKFARLNEDGTLAQVLPADAVVRVPELATGDATVLPGQICIENIDATYEHVGSSIRDSFRGRGSHTLVLNDEAHHIYSPIASDAVKRWKAFLDDEAYGFQRMVGFSGTCYRGNDYFSDVVYRYSLREAIDDGRVKRVHYVSRDESADENERFQKYLQVHSENEIRYSSLKPLTLLVTAKIAAAESLASRLKVFLRDRQGLSADEADARVLVVTSKPSHRENMRKLQTIDEATNPAQWVVSVSMLTEGWDAQNVFQVIPHEKRAFDSKLLIAQVLGRGLRVPSGTASPVLRVFNHAAWSNEINNLVQEVLEDDKRLRSQPITDGERVDYHFDLDHLLYRVETSTTDLTSGGGESVNLFVRGFVQLETQSPVLDRATTFVNASTGDSTTMQTRVEFKVLTVEDAVDNMYRKLRAVDLESGSDYARRYPRSRLMEVVQASLANIGETRGLVSEANLQRLLRAMGNVRRDIARTVRIERIAESLITVSTRDLPTRGLALSNFERDATMFYDSCSTQESSDQEFSAFSELTDDDSRFPRRATRYIENKYYFKSPVDVVLTTHAPERDFVSRLFEPEVAAKLHGWVKSTDTGFYQISYSWRRGDHTKQGSFNPDLFLRIVGSEDVIVVELKDDGDLSDENRAKLRFAREHFDLLNAQQDVRRYRIMFISPESFDGFFSALRLGTAWDYVSAIEANLR